MFLSSDPFSLCAAVRRTLKGGLDLEAVQALGLLPGKTGARV